MEKLYTSERNTQILISLMKFHGVKKIVASPGTTNVCFVGSLQHDPYFEIYSSVDERSAAYIACGLARESGEPVALYLFSIGIQMGEGYIWWKLGDANCGSALKLSAMLSSAVFCLIANNFIKSKSNISNFNWLVQIGDCSFGIYCSHILVLKVLRQIPGYDLLPFGVNSLVVMLTCFACVTIGQKICGQKLSRWLGISAS